MKGRIISASRKIAFDLIKIGSPKFDLTWQPDEKSEGTLTWIGLPNNPERHYVNRPADPQQINGVLVEIGNKVISDLLSGAMTAGIFKVFVQMFGPVGAAQFANAQLSREGDFIFIDGERFLAEQSAKTGAGDRGEWNFPEISRETCGLSTRVVC